MKKSEKPREFLYRIEVICKSDNGTPFYVPLSDFFHCMENADEALDCFKSKPRDWYKDNLPCPMISGGPMVMRYRKL